MITPASQPAIQSLYPDLSLQELRRAEENLEGYLALVIRIYTRISQDPNSLAELRAALNPANSASEAGPLAVDDEL
jgi:hypothetical protein